MRQWFLFITLAFATIGILAASAHAATLKAAQIHVASDVVILSDVFAGVASPAADMQIALAPPPGKTILLDSATLYGIAASNHIDWAPRGQNEKVIVLRDGDAVSGMAIQGTNVQSVIPPLTQALIAKGAGDRLAILLDAGEQQRLLSVLPADTVLAVDSLSFDPATRHFSATLSDAATGQRHAASGRAIAMVSVPVPLHRIIAGDIIRAGDISLTDARVDQLRSDAVLKSDALIGKIAKTQLEANLPVQQRFLGLPTIIKRGDRVTMIVNTGGITLTAEGHAENDAGMGEIVRLTNVASSKTIEGIATGTNTAEIRTDSAIITASGNAGAATVTR